jgi:hypothetical protein
MTTERCGHGLAYRHLEDSDVIAEPFEAQAVELGEVPLQVFRKIYSPSRLKNPDSVAWCQIVGFDESVPGFREIFRRKHPFSLVVSGHNLVTAAGKLFEVGGG